MQAIKWILAVAIFVVSPALFAAGSNDVAVSHYEPLQRLSVRSANANAVVSRQKIQQGAPVTLSFDALGRSFDLQLEPNVGLLAATSRSAHFDGINIYRGHLTGSPGSWVRIVMFNGVPRGLVWDGAEMFAIEAPGDSLVAVNSPVIYRLADAVITPGSMTCGNTDLAGNGAAAYSQLVDELDTTVAQALGAVSEITMGAIGDFEFTSDKGGDAGAATAITNRLNIVDGIFSDQVGVQINVQSIDTHNDVNDPFTDTIDPRTLLDELSEHRLDTAAQRNLGLTHLWTGRDLDSSTVGIAWRGGMCSNFFGAGLSEGNGNPTFDSLIAAHEIGHNFNAEHDGEAGTPCESDPETFIMAPAVNQNPQFSACSIAVMQTWAASHSCVTPIPAVDVSIELESPVSNVLLGANTVLTYDVSSNGLSSVSAVVADFTLPNNLALVSVTTTAGTCTSGTGTVNCALGDIPELTTRTVTITTTPTTVGAGMLSATVTTTDIDERPGNNLSAVPITVTPAVDLVVNTPTAATILVAGTTTVNAVLENRSVMDATGITLSISLSIGLQANSANWSLGTCVVTPQQIDCVASDFAAQSSATLNIGVTGITAGSKTLGVALSSVEADANPADNSINGSVRVNSPDADEEGGGAAAPIFQSVLLLIAAFVRRREIKRQKQLGANLKI